MRASRPPSTRMKKEASRGSAELEQHERERQHYTGYGGHSSSTQQQQAATHYDVLRVTASVSAYQITTAYRKLALKFHPDKTKRTEDGERFKLMTGAYAILSDATERRKYIPCRYCIHTSIWFIQPPVDIQNEPKSCNGSSYGVDAYERRATTRQVDDLARITLPTRLCPLLFDRPAVEIEHLSPSQSITQRQFSGQFEASHTNSDTPRTNIIRTLPK